MELKIYAPTDEQFPKSIDFNHEELKRELAEKLKKYDGVIYSDDSIKDAKSDRANLNKFKAAIEDRRKDIKKQCLKPYEDFEKKVKEIIALVDKPILAIDGQIKAYEEDQKKAKKQEIAEAYTEIVKPELFQIIPLAQIFNDRWLNVTYNMANIKQDIELVAQQVEADLGVIDTLESEFSLQIKDYYIRTRDLSGALREKARLEERKASLAEYEQSRKAPKEEPKEQTAPAPRQPEITQEDVIDIPSVEVLDFRVWVTPEQKQLLKEFLVSNQIRYGKVG